MNDFISNYTTKFETQVAQPQGAANVNQTTNTVQLGNGQANLLELKVGDMFQGEIIAVAGEEKRAGVAAGPKGPGWSMLFGVWSLEFEVCSLQFGYRNTSADTFRCSSMFFDVRKGYKTENRPLSYTGCIHTSQAKFPAKYGGLL